MTNAAQIQEAARNVGSLDVLIDNAGVALYDDLSDRFRARPASGRQPLRYLRRDAGLPAVAGSFRGAVVNNLSVNAFAPLPLSPSYSVSKAVAFNLTQSLRTLLAGQA